MKWEDLLIVLRDSIDDEKTAEALYQAFKLRLTEDLKVEFRPLEVDNFNLNHLNVIDTEKSSKG